MTRIATDLRLWRQQFYLTQAQAAGWLALSTRSYGAFERGERVPPVREVQRLTALMDAFYAGREIGMDLGRPV